MTNTPKPAAPRPAAASHVTLVKNHGLTVNGRADKFYAAGTKFDPVADAHTISALVKSGAQIGH